MLNPQSLRLKMNLDHGSQSRMRTDSGMSPKHSMPSHITTTTEMSMFSLMNRVIQSALRPVALNTSTQMLKVTQWIIMFQTLVLIMIFLTLTPHLISLKSNWSIPGNGKRIRRRNQSSMTTKSHSTSRSNILLEAWDNKNKFTEHGTQLRIKMEIGSSQKQLTTDLTATMMIMPISSSEMTQSALQPVALNTITQKS